MSRHTAFRRQPVPGEYAQQQQVTTIPAPTRGLVLNENEAFMQPGGALVMDNWAPTLRGCQLRGGFERWCVLDAVPVISAFEYITSAIGKMFAAQATKLFDVTASLTPTLVKSGQTSGNYAAAQYSNAAGEWLIAVNDAGDFPLRFNGTSWVTLDPAAGAPSDGAATITYDPTTKPTGIVDGKGLVYVWKYRNRLFFIQQGSMNAWYLGIDAVGGVLKIIPLSGSASKGGKLLFGATWSLDAGDGTDDKCVFFTDLGEALVFTGTDPGVAANWRQEGRYQTAPPLGMNAHVAVGGDLLIATVDGIVPLSQAVSRDAGQMELARVSRTIKPMWRREADAKRDAPWSFKKWDEYGGIFMAWPGGAPGERSCLVMNSASNAFARYLGYDATCFIRLEENMFFGTQDGIIMQAERTGYDDGKPYVATLVGGWEMFRSGSATVTWRQARAVFTARNNEPFVPQISATTDFVITVPAPPQPGLDPGPQDVWDEGLWDAALWDQPSLTAPSMRNTMWVSIGKTGFTHAPIVQITVAQQTKPTVELVAIAATFERAGVTV